MFDLKNIIELETATVTFPTSFLNTTQPKQEVGTVQDVCINVDKFAALVGRYVAVPPVLGQVIVILLLSQ